MDSSVGNKQRLNWAFLLNGAIQVSQFFKPMSDQLFVLWLYQNFEVQQNFDAELWALYK